MWHTHPCAGSIWLNFGYFTARAEAEARWEAGRLLIRKTQLLAVSDTLRSIRPRGSDDESPVCKAHRAVSPVIPEVFTSTESSMMVSSVTSYAGTATSYDLPAPHSILYGGQPPMLPMSIPLPRFANKDFVPSPVRSALVATRPYPSSSESHASTACVDLYAFASKSSRSSDGYISVTVSSDNEQTNMAMELSRFQLLKRPQSLVNISSNHIMRRQLCP